MDYKHVSVDIETLALAPDAVIVSIGAICFNPHLWPVQTACDLAYNPSFYRRTTIDHQLKAGRKIQDGTMRWWLKQGVIARTTTFADNEAIPLCAALNQFAVFLATYARGAHLWSNPSAFDLGAVRHATEQCSIPQLSGHKQTPDGSTLAYLTGVDHPAIPFEGTRHNALDDAVHQAREIQWHMNRIAVTTEPERSDG